MSKLNPKNKYDALAYQLIDCARVLRAMGNDADPKKGIYRSDKGDAYVHNTLIPTIVSVVPYPTKKRKSKKKKMSKTKLLKRSKVCK